MRLMVYSHDTFGLGNIRRMLAICEHLHRTFPDLSILIVSGSPMLQSFRVSQGIDYIKLPCLKRSETGELGVRFLPMDVEEIIRLRRDLLLSTVISFKPDVVMVDKKPDGLAAEMEPALRYIRCSLPQTMVALVLRDILDSQDVTRREWHTRGYYNILRWYYDKILVLGSRDIYDVCHEYHIPETLGRKVEFCGYVARETVVQDRIKFRTQLGISNDDSLVLATAGGGEDGFMVLLRTIEAAKTFAANQKIHTLVVSGPEMSTTQRSLLLAATEKSERISVVEFAPDMLSLMHAADVVVSMGGYNSICELASLNKVSVIVPRAEPVREQTIRMERMSGRGPFISLELKELQADKLAGAITSQLELCDQHSRGKWQLDMGALNSISSLMKQHAHESTTYALAHSFSPAFEGSQTHDEFVEAAAS